MIAMGAASTFRLNIALILTVAALAAVNFFAGGSFVQKAFAADITWDGGGDGFSFSDPLNWDTDTVPTQDDNIKIDGGAASNSVVHLDMNFGVSQLGKITISSSDELVVDSGITLTLAADGGSISIRNDGTLTNDGTINLITGDGTGIANGGTGAIINSGELIISNTGVSSAGIFNDGGTISNSGTITVANTDGIGIEMDVGATIINSGTINVASAGDAGIQTHADDSIINSGKMTIANTDGTGINNHGSITNSDDLIISNPNDLTSGLRNNDGATVENSGTLTVSNDGGLGILNDQSTLINSGTGTISVSNTNGIGINNVNVGNIANDGTLIVQNSGSGVGIFNDGGTVTNSGTMNIVINEDDKELEGISSNDGSIVNTNTGTILIGGDGNQATGILLKTSAELANSGILIIENSDGIGVFPLSGRLTNTGTITVNSGVAATGIRNDEGIENNGSIVLNSGRVINLGDLTNNGSIDIKAGATFSNLNLGTLNNENPGTIDNNGFFVNEAGGTVNNDGEIINRADGEIDNAGTIDNTFGTLFNECGGTIINTGTIDPGAVDDICDTIDPETRITNTFDGKGNKLVPKGKSIPTTTSTSVKVFVTGDDNVGVVNFECKIDNSGWTAATMPGDGTAFCEYSALKAGLQHTVYIKAVDAAGNVDETPATFTWKINPPKLK